MRQLYKITDPDNTFATGVYARYHEQHICSETTLCGVAESAQDRLIAAWAKHPLLLVEVGGRWIKLAGAVTD